MSIITFASSKGGAGKTTSAIVLATTLAKNSTVVLIDADPAARLMAWAERGELPANLAVMQSDGEKHIHDEIEKAADAADYVVIDLEGAATRLNSYAMAESDLVVIPMGDEQQDAEGAIETLAELHQTARHTRREIPVRVLFARTQAAVKSRIAKSLNAQVRDKIGAFATELHSRSAYSALHNYGGTLETLDESEVGGVGKAIKNAELFAEEVTDILRIAAEMKSAPSKPQTRKEKTHA